MDTLAGAKTARLEEIGATQYKSYGALAKINKNLLNRLMEQLIIEEYLLVGDFKTIKMGNIGALKNPDTKVWVKITDEDKVSERKTKTRKTAKGTEALTSIGFKLFDALRALRLVIAREEAMPPYIIFSDKTLIDMAAKVPMTQSEMLDVSGVGDNKFFKYGERFLEEIENCVNRYPELLQNKKQGIHAAQVETVELKKKLKKVGKEDFSLLPSEAEQFQYLEYRYISDIRDEMNRIADKDRVKRVTNTKLIEILMENDLIYEKETAGVYFKAPTVKGETQNIKLIKKQSESGHVYSLVIYPENIQRMLVEYFVKY